ncbi:hypothetical protein [Chryseobacterium sp. 22458]|uniref:hypothetical protein n=1 Tax=Chryseobacterium sp. 22458 TaxID=3453921 RepID=UPI003F850FDE
MSTYLHLSNDRNEEPRFMHPITNLITEEIGQEFEYDDHYYFQLTEKAIKDFKNHNLTKGTYIIAQKYYTEIGQYWTVIMYKKKKERKRRNK